MEVLLKVGCLVHFMLLGSSRPYSGLILEENNTYLPVNLFPIFKK